MGTEKQLKDYTKVNVDVHTANCQTDLSPPRNKILPYAKLNSVSIKYKIKYQPKFVPLKGTRGIK